MTRRERLVIRTGCVLGILFGVIGTVLNMPFMPGNPKPEQMLVSAMSVLLCVQMLGMNRGKA